MPLEYVLDAYKYSGKIMQQECHAAERPVALLTQLTANLNRNPKKTKPATIEQFYLYQPSEQKNLPQGRYGAAAIALIKDRLLPGWALFCYKDLVSNAGDYEPMLLGFLSDKAILLAPIATDDGFSGMLIAKESASDKWVTMSSPCGRTVTLLIPHLTTKYVAMEDVKLRSRLAS